MRENLPVTQQEYDFPADATLMSTTDPLSHITYANDAFISASGYSREEIEGQPHNLVRHPDMPAAAFEDMWRTLKGGGPWTAIVKNRRKNGDHYWVRANVTPIMRDGKITGYLSVRTKPSRAEIDAAAALYARMRQRGAKRVRFHKGVACRTGPMAWTAAFRTMPAQWRIRGALGFSALATLGSAAAVGLGGPALLEFSACLAGATALVSLWLRLQISRPLERMRAQALRVVAGDTMSALHMDRCDEIGTSMRTIGQLGLMFRRLIDDVSGQVFNAKTATAEIAQGDTDLSSRTGQAAASEALISTSVGKIESSAKQVDDAGKLMNEIVSQVNRVSGLIAEIAAATSEQSDGVSQVSEAIGRLDRVTQQNAALVEQSSAASESLRQQMSRLADAVGVFQ